jgi:hypothetical protein
VAQTGFNGPDVPRVRRLFASVAAIAALWALALYAGYGRTLSIGPWQISSRNPTRPLLACTIAAAAYALASGATGLRRDATRLRSVTSRGARGGRRAYEWIEARLAGFPLALLITALSIAVALSFRESAAGGADSFSYVTQADLWLSAAPGLRVEMPIASEAPWPGAIGTFTPFGYRATPDGRAAVPVTAPGLSLLMAGFKKAAGHCAMFWVVPLSGGLLIWATFLIGRRIGADGVGVTAAWLTATSPAFLAMTKAVMSDVPAAAFSALAIALALSGSPAAALGAGLSVSAAIVIRQNLLSFAVVLAAWVVWRDTRSGTDRRMSRTVAFAAGMLPGCLAIAFINRALYGSPFRPGYGDVSGLFAWSHVAVNVRQYTSWLIETQTPIALIGVAALVMPWRRVWPTPFARSAARLLRLVLLAVFAVYAAYTPFHDWWYLRFLLPAWPAIVIGIAALSAGLVRGRTVVHRGVATLAIAGLGLHGIATARRLGVYPPGEGERRYATIAGLVASATDAQSVIVTTAHVGPMRYYGGRLTLRYDTLDPAWLDRALDWLERRGRHPYILLEEDEVPEFRRRFNGSAAGRFDLAPVMTYEADRIAGRVYLFDPLKSPVATWQPAPIRSPQPRCPPPARPPDYR